MGEADLINRFLQESRTRSVLRRQPPVDHAFGIPPWPEPAMWAMPCTALLTAQPIRKYQAPELEISLDLPELVEPNATLKITAEADSDRLALIVTATHYESTTSTRGPVLRNEGDGLYSCELSLPSPGAWRLTLSPAMPAPVEPVTEIVVAVNPDGP